MLSRLIMVRSLELPGCRTVRPDRLTHMGVRAG
jgi:hypothetical protein